MKILVTGATGYVGGRLIPRLLEGGHEVTILVRDPKRVSGRDWIERVHVLNGDLLDDNSLLFEAHFDVAFYLVHSMSDSTDFATLETTAAENFTRWLNPAVHIIYLGGIKPEKGETSVHLGSRIHVGDILRKTHSVTELRAGPIIGSGSASFEMVRNLTERLPVMIAPKWVKNRIRPIAVRDILEYLIQSTTLKPIGVLDVGCEMPIRFIDMMLIWAEVRGLKRWIIPVPVLAPGLAARWVGLVTPITNRLAVPIIKGMQSSIIGNTSDALNIFPQIKPICYRRAVELALKRIERDFIETRWSGALGRAPSYVLEEREGIIHETRSMKTSASPQTVYDVFIRAGGENGWFAWNWAWRIRGAIDRFVGGPGTRRGRRHPVELLPGEAVDFWRVEQTIPGEYIRLRAEMKVPGQAWLEWHVQPEGQGSVLAQTAFFNPTGVSGRLYWILLYPIHSLIFSAMIRNILKRAEKALEDSLSTKTYS